MEMKTNFRFIVHPNDVCILRLKSADNLPLSKLGTWYSLTRTPTEFSLVCEQSAYDALPPSELSLYYLYTNFTTGWRLAWEGPRGFRDRRASWHVHDRGPCWDRKVLGWGIGPHFRGLHVQHWLDTGFTR